jgi:hypothetical protein
MRFPQTQKPPLGSQINWSHPLSKGLVGCWLMNEGSGDRIYDLSGKGNNGSLVGANTLWNPGYINAPGNGGHYITFGYKPSFVFGASDFTISIKMVKNAASTTYSNAFFICRGSSGADSNTNSFRWLLSNDGNDEKSVFQIRFTGASVAVVGPSDLVIGRIYTLTVMRSGDNLFHFTDGVLDGTVSGATGTITGTGNYPLNIGAYATTTTGSSSANAKVYHLSIYNRALSPQEVSQLYQSPYAMFERRPVWMDWTQTETGISILTALSATATPGQVHEYLAKTAAETGIPIATLMQYYRNLMGGGNMRC